MIKKKDIQQSFIVVDNGTKIEFQFKKNVWPKTRGGHTTIYHFKQKR